MTPRIFDNVLIGNRIGFGHSCYVHKATMNGKSYAIKLSRGDYESRESVLKESSILSSLHQDKEALNSNIIKKVAIVYEDYFRKVGLVLELQDMNLATHIATHENGLSLEMTRQLTEQMAKALSFLDKSGVIHLNVGPTNILVSKDGTFKLAGFNLFCHKSRAEDTSVYDGFIKPCQCRSPEVLLEIPPTSAVDIWSLGAVVIEAFTRCMAFDSQNPAELLASQQVRLQKEYSMDHLERRVSMRRFGNFLARHCHTPPNNMNLREFILENPTTKQKSLEKIDPFIDLVHKMLELDPKHRITAKQTLEHTFVAHQVTTPTTHRASFITPEMLQNGKSKLTSLPPTTNVSKGSFPSCNIQ